MTVVELAAVLHAARCQSLSWSDDCRSEYGGRHAREQWRPIARAALDAPDAAVVIHDHVCDAHLDPCHTCPDVPGHINKIREDLGL